MPSSIWKRFCRDAFLDHGRIVVVALAVTALLGACAMQEPLPGPPRKEIILAVTASHDLIRVNAGRPGQVLSRVALRGMAPGEQVLGIDFRVAYGVMYALGDSGRIYTVDPGTGMMTALGPQRFPVDLQGSAFGFDFNPAADRIRIVSDTGQNLRAHPVTGALVDAEPGTPGLQVDGPLRYAPGDVHAGQAARVTAAAYTYNQRDEKLTTNFAIDLARGTLVRQGSVEGQSPVVSPNTGWLSTVGPLGTGPLADASFDIADVSNAPIAAVSARGLLRRGATRLVLIDLATGQARSLGRLDDGGPVRGLAIEP